MREQDSSSVSNTDEQIKAVAMEAVRRVLAEPFTPAPADPDAIWTHDDMREQFVLGAVEMREMLARFVEQGGDALTAMSLRANWNPEWGPDPSQRAAIAKAEAPHA